MELQAERIQAERHQPPLDDLQRCHLLGDEQHPLAPVQAIGYDVGNCLALARPGRAVQHETPPGHRVANGPKLRRVGTQRLQDLRRRTLVVDIPLSLRRNVRYLQLPCDQAGDGRTVRQHLPMCVDVVPDDELVEGEVAQEHQVLHVPALFVHNGAAERIQDFLEIDVPVLLGKGVQAGNPDIVLLPEHLQQGEIDRKILARSPDAVCRLRDLDRNQKDRGAVCPSVFIHPAKRTDRQIKGIGAVLLQGAAGTLPQVVKHHKGLRFWDIAVQAAVSQFPGDIGDHIVQMAYVAEKTGVGHEYRKAHHADGYAENMETPSLLQGSYDSFGDSRNQLQQTPAMEVDQVVPQRQVEQFALPYRISGYLDRRIQFDFIYLGKGFRLPAERRGGVFNDIAFRRQYPQRKRQNAHIPGRSDIHIAAETVRIRQLFFGPGRGHVETVLVSFQEAQRLYKQYFLDSGGNPFAQRGGIIVHRIRRRRKVCQPGAGIGVPVVNYDERTQAYGLQTTGIEQGRVQAGGETAGEDVFCHPDPLSLCGKRSRGRRIDNLFFAERTI